MNNNFFFGRLQNEVITHNTKSEIKCNSLSKSKKKNIIEDELTSKFKTTIKIH
jgi:hypothetical protein